MKYFVLEISVLNECLPAKTAECAHNLTIAASVRTLSSSPLPYGFRIVLLKRETKRDNNYHHSCESLSYQTFYFAGPLCRVNPLTDRGKRFQLIKILCLTVIPILGVWGFTMYSLSDSVKSKSEIEVVSVLNKINETEQKTELNYIWRIYDNICFIETIRVN